MASTRARLALRAATAIAALIAIASGAQADNTQALEIFKSTCFDALEDFEAAVSQAGAKGWQPTRTDADNAFAILKNYGDEQLYRDVRVLANPQAGHQYLLAYVAANAETGEMKIGAQNYCLLIDTSADGPIKKDTFDIEFNPILFEKYLSFIATRQVYYASSDAAPQPRQPFGAGRPKVEIGLSGLVLGTARFAEGEP